MNIDYEKLKKAHELIKNISFGKLKLIYSEHDGIEYYFSYADSFLSADKHGNFYYTDIDELLIKLQELTQPKPKYEVGEEVWVIYQDEPVTACIWKIEGDRYHLGLDFGHFFLKEKYIHKNKLELIQSQIDYWTKLKQESQEPCQHESDGILKDNSGTFELGCYKCTKCGEYYK